MQQDMKTRPAEPRRKPFARAPRLDLVRMGNIDVERVGLPKARLDDVYHRLMRAPWPIFCAVFGAYYLTMNLLFGSLYYQDLAGIQNAKAGSFTDAFMFSVQTIATIGYGHLAPASGFINTVVVVESMTGLLSLALWSGIAFARFSRPTARVLFSSHAVIAANDGVPTLMFRVANGRGNRIVDASISVIMLRNERTKEGVEWRRQYNLDLVRNRSPVFALSWTVMHRIDEQSPLRAHMAEGAENSPVDLVVSLTGIDDTFAQNIHAMSTYPSGAILPGKRFADMSGIGTGGRPMLDFSKFDELIDEA
jgi:inward rectifier potassium channel